MRFLLPFLLGLLTASCNGQSSLDEPRPEIEKSDTRTSVDCSSMQGPYLDANIGFLMAVPVSFKALSDPPTSLQTFDLGNDGQVNEVTGENVIILADSMDGMNREAWHPTIAEHELSALVDTLEASYTETNGLPIFLYAMLVDDKGFFVTSTVPIRVESLLDCLFRS